MESEIRMYQKTNITNNNESRRNIMTSLSVVGVQWGDEGKGKFVDLLSQQADYVTRFQGGSNAGHTIVIEDKVFKLRLLPSGVIRSNIVNVIGNGVVLNPWQLIKEIENVASQGVTITPEQLIIADNVTLLLPMHMELDAARENIEAFKIGTTKSGIAPAYEDKVGRRSIRLCDLQHPDTLKDKINRLVDYHNIQRKHYGIELLDTKTVYDEVIEVSIKVLPFMKRTNYILKQALNDGKKVLFEGAQGTFLDVDHGTYPYVTSSNTVAANIGSGTGLGVHAVDKCIGIVKAYTTRVGLGPFPTELSDDIGAHIAKVGHEKGTVTGRDRRCGWLDTVLVKQGLLVNGVDGVILTKIDVLDDLDEIKICTGYILNGQEIDYVPNDLENFAKAEPIYITMPGWKGQSTFGVTDINTMPENARNYINKIQELINCPIWITSTGPERNQNIIHNEPWQQ